jgi:predicted RND superfamily exporter protein
MNRLWTWWISVGQRSPVATLSVAAVVLALAGWAAAGLTVDSSRHSMVRADHPAQALQLRWFERFGYPDQMVMVVGGGTPALRHRAADYLVADLEQDPRFQGRVRAKIDPESIADIMLLAPTGAGLEGTDDQNYFTTADGAHTLVLIHPEIPGTQQAEEVRPWVERIRQARDTILAAGGAEAGLEMGLTGAPVLVVDEQTVIEESIARTSVVTGLALLVLLWIGFGSLRWAVLAILPVALGVACTMAAARGLYGGLNMVTSSSTSILLGLGIDFGVYLLWRLGELRRAGLDRLPAIPATLERAGAALAWSALTTACAFWTISLTEFTAYARLGVMVSIGLLASLLLTFLILPALLTLGTRDTTPPPRAWKRTPWLGLVRHAAGPSLVAGAAITAGLSLGLPQVTFSTRFYDFIPQRIESARWLPVIEADPRTSPLRATVEVADLDEARALGARLEALPSVARVMSAADLLAPWDRPEVERRMAASRLLGDSPALNRAREAARAALERDAVGPDDLPAWMHPLWRSRDGQTLALHVLPAGDLWQPQEARRFYEEVTAVAPGATGLAMSTHLHLTWIREGFLRAAGLAALLILLIVGVAFRRLGDATLTLAPTALGFVWTLGGMGLLGLPLNAANVIALPILLGISIDANVHLVHRVRESQRLDEVLGGTGSASVLALMTTLAAFGSLMLTDYGAMRSLGLTMVLGLAANLVTSVILLPAWLRWRGRLA